MRTTTNSMAALCAAALIAGAAVFGLPGRPPAPPARVSKVASKTSVSVTTPAPAPPAPHVFSQPVRWTGPGPAPAPAAASPDCPQMTNPGGRLVAAKGGPDKTDGSVSIPAIGAHAPIVRVGFDSSWHMILPKNARDVAWLDQGDLPGATNNVVLAGHIDWGGATGAFATLDRLRPGDVVTISLHGRTFKYSVRFSCFFPYNSRRGQQVIGYTPVPSLTMVSCAGTWNSGAGTHSKRIVVRAEQIYPPVAHTDAQHGGASSPRPSHTPAPTATPKPGVIPLHNR